MRENHTRQQILKAARLIDCEIGDGAMIAEMEWGYWIGSISISKDEIETSETNTTP